MLASGTKVGRYVVLDQLGEGAMGEVYRAWDDALDRMVALKLLLPLRADNPKSRKRFARESRLAARINHPAVAHIYDVGEHDGVPFIAMEFVPGKQLRNELTGPLPEPRVLFLLRQIVEGLCAAHEQGVVHRDLKPENIMISGRDQVKILDFGLAKPILDDASEATSLSNTGITGTPRYMAPEQIQGTPVDPRTDVYALGTVMYEMITGTQCHVGRTLGELLMAVVNRPAPRIPEGFCDAKLAAIVSRCLQKAPEDRFVNGQDLQSALQLMEPEFAAPLAQRGDTQDPPHPRALKYAQRAREALNGITSSSSTAMELAEQALALDPGLGLAHALYAEAAAALFHTGHLDAKWLERAQDALERAEALDPELPDLRVARARLLWTRTFNFPAETALRELRSALIAAPDHIGALRLWATICAHVGLLDQAEAAMTRGLSLDPADEVLTMIRASLHMADGRPQQANSSLARVLKLDPKHEDPLFWWIHSHALIVQGDLVTAEADLKASLRRHPKDPLFLGLWALLQACQGNRETARSTLDAVQSLQEAELHPHHTFHLSACTEAVLGNPTASLHWLKRTAEEGMPCWPWFAKDPLLANLREAPEGATYLQTLKARFEFFAAEFPFNDPATLAFVATQVAD